MFVPPMVSQIIRCAMIPCAMIPCGTHSSRTLDVLRTSDEASAALGVTTSNFMFNFSSVVLFCFVPRLVTARNLDHLCSYDNQTMPTMVTIDDVSHFQILSDPLISPNRMPQRPLTSIDPWINE